MKVRSVCLAREGVRAGIAVLELGSGRTWAGRYRKAKVPQHYYD